MRLRVFARQRGLAKELGDQSLRIEADKLSITFHIRNGVGAARQELDVHRLDRFEIIAAHFGAVGDFVERQAKYLARLRQFGACAKAFVDNRIRPSGLASRSARFQS